MKLNYLTCSLLTFLLFASIGIGQQRNIKLDKSVFKAGYDIPLGIEHGTWDFDEWPGVDHQMKYIENFMYNSVEGEKLKIDYTANTFDANDHEGYLKSPGQLKMRGFKDLGELLTADTENKTIVGIFVHPDDEILLAGGLFAYAASKGWNAKIFLVSNGADGSEGVDDEESDILGGYNSFGVMPDGTTRVDMDIKGQRKFGVVAGYSRKLGVKIDIMKFDLNIEGKHVVQIGETPGLDWEKTFGEGTIYRQAIADNIIDILRSEQPAIVVTHGADGEYGNYLHKLANRLVIKAVESTTERPMLLTSFPEFNYQDHISHFIDLDADNKFARNKKNAAFKAITFLHTPGMDYDKPWNPTDDLMDGAFVKDYGYTPTKGDPPRYEFFMNVKFGRE
jgi:LmbE family N-acetylglucosaminyl deacetylase